MKRLIDALHVIQEECSKYYKRSNSDNNCNNCPMNIFRRAGLQGCIFDSYIPRNMTIDEVQKALLEKEQT